MLSPSISIDQHGFISDKTTDTNQFLFKKFILDAFASSVSQIDAFYTDFSKAFDKVNHTLCLYLYSILHKIGIRGRFLSWISYQTEHK